jgi:hypothetical protein
LREKSLSEEGSSVVRLQPPYAVLLEGWVRRNGALAVSVDADTVHLDAATHSNLVLIAEERAAVASAGLWAKAATAFWTSLLINGIGFRDVSVTASGKIKIDLRAPASPEEFDKVPALARLNDMLSAKFLAAVEPKQRQEAGKAKQEHTAVFAHPLGDVFVLETGGECRQRCRNVVCHRLLSKKWRPRIRPRELRNFRVRHVSDHHLDQCRLAFGRRLRLSQRRLDVFRIADTDAFTTAGLCDFGKIRTIKRCAECMPVDAGLLHEGLADSKYRPCPLLVKYVEAGWLGRKTKRGFYDYRGEVPVPTR